MAVTAKCGNCGWQGGVKISVRKRPGKIPAITGIPCPKCKKHKLRRVK